MRINIQTVPYSEMRYPSAGDYWLDDDGTVQVRVAVSSEEIAPKNSEFAVIIHELIELWLTTSRGIEWKSIDSFDKAFEAARKDGNESEPGDAPDSPYRKEHRFAENIERQLIHEMGIDWAEHDKQITSL